MNMELTKMKAKQIIIKKYGDDIKWLKNLCDFDLTYINLLIYLNWYIVDRQTGSNLELNGGWRRMRRQSECCWPNFRLCLYFHLQLSGLHFWPPRTSLAHHSNFFENVANVASMYNAVSVVVQREFEKVLGVHNSSSFWISVRHKVAGKKPLKRNL